MIEIPIGILSFPKRSRIDGRFWIPEKKQVFLGQIRYSEDIFAGSLGNYDILIKISKSSVFSYLQL